MLSSDWLIKGICVTNLLVFFPINLTLQVYLSMEIPYSLSIYHVTRGKFHAQEKIPSLSSWWRHGCNSEFLGFLLSTNEKVKKNDRWQCQPLCLKSLKCTGICFKFICINSFYMLYIVAKRRFKLFSILLQKYTSLKRIFLFS